MTDCEKAEALAEKIIDAMINSGLDEEGDLYVLTQILKRAKAIAKQSQPQSRVVH